MSNLRFAVLGCGFWAPYQIAAWRELEGVELVALYNRTRSKADALARQFGVPAVYDDAEKMLANEELDFIDIITGVDTHSQFVHLAAKHKIPVICQKPMAPDLAIAEAMVSACREAGVPFMIHENWRWQYPIRQLKKAMNKSNIGKPFRGHILYANSFPVFANQPFLKDLDQFILTDIGSHILDTARYLFGDASRLYCQTSRVNPEIKGEDVATVMMEMGDGVTVTCEMSYASRLEHERFPETYVRVECENGSVELCPDFWIRATKGAETIVSRHVPPRYPWADPAYDVVHSSAVPCNADLLRSLRTGEPAETSGEDNLKTMRLVFASYESAAKGQAIALPR
ncbi:MAG: Gfo/Idh/MocA family oxidoreductase [Armatimonadota bacterium]|nr:Gfo/Idh/MocA family oxidoreductase [Armatimonadota bacterium]